MGMAQPKPLHVPSLIERQKALWGKERLWRQEDGYDLTEYIFCFALFKVTFSFPPPPPPRDPAPTVQGASFYPP